jgi:hypothetical protein
MSDYVFEINPEQYLYKSDEGKCYFVIHKCRLPGKNKNLFLIGDAFLRHFYSVYDFDRDQVSLGINVHSKDKVAMYKPGGRPKDLVKTEVEAQNVEPAAETPQEKPAADETKTEKPDTTTATQTSEATEESEGS